MADASSNHWKRVWQAVSQAGATLFRNNTGLGWVGRAKKLRAGQVITAEHGDVLVKNARPLHAGLIEGAGDGIGWVPVTITEDMVGRTVAVFLSVEAKYGTGRLETAQRTWHSNVLAAGGISIVARSPEQAVDDLRQQGLPFERSNG